MALDDSLQEHYIRCFDSFKLIRYLGPQGIFHTGVLLKVEILESSRLPPNLSNTSGHSLATQFRQKWCKVWT